MKLELSIVFIVIALLASACASNIVVSNCRQIKVENDDKPRWLCDKTLSDQWRYSDTGL